MTEKKPPAKPPAKKTTPAKKVPPVKAARAPRIGTVKADTGDAVHTATVLPMKKPVRRVNGTRRPANQSPISPEQIELLDRRTQALEMRRAGYTFPQIAERLGARKGNLSYDASRARKDVEAMRDTIAVTVNAEYIQSELDLIAGVQRMLYTDMLNPTDARIRHSAVEKLRGWVDMRLKIMGGYSAQKHSIVDAEGDPVKWFNAEDDLASLQAAALAELATYLPELPPMGS